MIVGLKYWHLIYLYKSGIVKVMTNRKGFALFIIILGILIILGIAGGTYYARIPKNQPLSHNLVVTSQTTGSEQDKFAQAMKELGCNSPASCIAVCAKPENREKCHSV